MAEIPLPDPVSQLLFFQSQAFGWLRFPLAGSMSEVVIPHSYRPLNSNLLSVTLSPSPSNIFFAFFKDCPTLWVLDVTYKIRTMTIRHCCKNWDMHSYSQAQVVLLSKNNNKTQKTKSRFFPNSCLERQFPWKPHCKYAIGRPSLP